MTARQLLTFRRAVWCTRREPVERLDVLVVGSGVAGLSAAVRLADSAVPGSASSPRASWSSRPHVGPRAVSPRCCPATKTRQIFTWRTRSAQGRGCATRPRFACLSTKAPSGFTSSSPSAPSSTGVREVTFPERGKAVTRQPVSCTGRHHDRSGSGARARRGGARQCRGDPRGLVRPRSGSRRDPLHRCDSARPRRSGAGTSRQHTWFSPAAAQAQMYAVTTNPVEATGDGIAMALRPGFRSRPGVRPVPPDSASSCGHAAPAHLRSTSGPRCGVPRRRRRTLRGRTSPARPREPGDRRQAGQEASEHVWLDATASKTSGEGSRRSRKRCRRPGSTRHRDWLPVAPAAHYLSGGVLVDLDGATALPGLWAAGEVACSGVHGANRLASNSLLEGMVFGARCVDAILAGRDGPEPTGALGGLGSGPGQVRPGASRSGPIGVRPVSDCRCSAEVAQAPSRTVAAPPAGDPSAAAHRAAVQAAMTNWAGVVRDASSLRAGRWWS